MFFSAIAGTLSLSLALFLLSPRFPDYQISKIRVLSVSLSHLLLRWMITCTVVVDVEIENANFIGAFVHSTIMDLYYPDWEGVLQPIAALRDKHTYEYQFPQHNVHNDWMNRYENKTYTPILSRGQDPENIYNRHSHVKLLVNDSFQELMEQQVEGAIPSPFFLPPRTKALMNDAIIVVSEVGPRISLPLLLEFFRSPFGEIRMLSAGVAHVKASIGLPPALPATVSVMCDHRINALVFPARIIDRTCSPVEIFPGWLNKEEQRFRLQKVITARYKAYGSVQTPFDVLAMNERNELDSVEEWFDF
jgi:hypothetical protein